MMEKGTNAPVFPDAELIVNGAEYNWWTEAGRVEKLAEGRRAAGKRIADVFPTWKNWKLVGDNTEVAPGVRIVAAFADHVHVHTGRGVPVPMERGCLSSTGWEPNIQFLLQPRRFHPIEYRNRGCRLLLHVRWSSRQLR